MIAAQHPVLNGTLSFVSDFAMSAELHARFIRSEVPHGRILELDLEGCMSSPGVEAVLTGADLQLPPIAVGEIETPVDDLFARPLLADAVVRFVGEPVAVVLANTEQQALDAAERASVDFDLFPAVVDPREAVDDITLLFPDAGTNTFIREVSPIEVTEDRHGLVEVTVEVGNPRLAPSPIEPPGIVASPTGGGRLSIVCGHQEPHSFRAGLAAVLGMDDSDIDVRVPAVGGSFGLKGGLIPEYVVVAAAARQLGRSVAWVATRRELFVSGTHGRSQENRVTLWGEESGRFVAVRLEVLADIGAYPQAGAGLPFNTRFVFPGPYEFRNFDSEVRVVVTNKAPVGPYRGAGRPEAAAALERAIDAFARKIQMDPADVRRRNLIPPDLLPFLSASGARYDSGDYPAALSRLLDELEYTDVRRLQEWRRTNGGNPLGVGLCCFVDRSGGGITNGEYGKVEVSADGDVIVRSGATSTGQPHSRLWARLAGAELGIDPTQVRVLSGDTAQVEAGVGTFGSRSAQFGGAAVMSAARTVRQILIDLAADILEANPADLSVAGGRILVRGSEDIAITFAEAASAGLRAGVPVEASEMYVPGAMTYPYGVCGVVVEVDPVTGQIRLLDLVIVADCGTVLDAPGVRDQTNGAVAQGFGEAMIEEFSYSTDGQPVTSSFMDYPLPSAIDTPSVRVIQVTHPAQSNLLGAKGVGELGTIGAPPAIVNAVIDALSPMGIERLDVPLRPDRVWSAIRDSTTSNRDPAFDVVV